MEIKIDGRHMKVTDSLQDHIEKKLNKLGRFFGGITGLHVVLCFDDHRPNAYSVEIICSLVRGQAKVIQVQDSDMYAAIDAAVQKLKEYLKRFKGRLRQHGRGRMGKTGDQKETPVEEPEVSG